MNWHHALDRQFKIPFLERFGRWLLSWRGVRAALFAPLVFVMLVALFYGIENWRGRYAWKRYRSAAEARGMQFDYRAVIPPPVPHEQNFAMTPLLRPLFDYDASARPVQWWDSNAWERASIGPYRRWGARPRPGFGDWTRGERFQLESWQRYYRNDLESEVTARALTTYQQEQEETFPTSEQPQSPAADVQLALTEFEPEMAEIELAVRRPYSRFPIHYDEGANTELPHLAILRTVAMLYQLRAVAALAQTNNEAAFKDLVTLFQIAEALKGEPFIISQTVRHALLNRALQTVWEGMCDHRWSEPQLVAVQHRLGNLDLLEEFNRTLNRERAFQALSNELKLQNRDDYRKSLTDELSGQSLPQYYQLYVRYAPSGWFYRNHIVFNQRIDELTANISEARTSGVFTAFSFRPVDWGNDLEKLLISDFLSSAVERLPHAHVNLKLAQTACALERFHLEHGAYPSSPDALIPQYLTRWPTDFMDGQPLRYRQVNSHRFLLYSVGPDRQDNGGAASTMKGASFTDWVWAIP